MKYMNISTNGMAFACGFLTFKRCLKCDWSEGKVLGKKSFWEIQKSTFLNMLKVAEAQLKAKFEFYLGQIRIIWTQNPWM